MRCVINLKRKITIQADGLLALSAILSTIVFAIVLTPVGMNAINTSYSMPCYTEALVNIASSITILLAGPPSIYFSITSIHALTKGRKARELDMLENIKQLFNYVNTK